MCINVYTAQDCLQWPTSVGMASPIGVYGVAKQRLKGMRWGGGAKGPEGMCREDVPPNNISINIFSLKCFKG